MKIAINALILFPFLFLLFPSLTIASSDYVLPYPSSMPGSRFYELHLIWEEILGYWHFGNFAQITYNLKQSDKYIVEAKTLFEYDQYLLARDALKKSDNYFTKIDHFIAQAEREKKPTAGKKELLKKAAQEHIRILTSLRDNSPYAFEWKPEKGVAQNLPIRSDIEAAIHIRYEYSQ